MTDIAVETADKNERLKEITDRLEQGIQNLFEGEKFKEYLNVMSKFHNYSYNNTILIAMQNPAASRVAGFNSWKNKFGRTVGKGEKGIQILAPAPFKVEREQEKIDKDTGLPMRDAAGKPIMETVEVTIPYFKVVNVFDVTQTHGKELPTLGVDELGGEVKDFDKFFEALKTVSPAPIGFEEIDDGGKGYYHHGDKRIAINEGMSEVQSCKTAIHEIAHAKLHDRDLIKADLAVPVDKSTMEVEAEAVAYTVCQHYGIDTSDYSFAYIAEWGSNKEMSELKMSLETIRNTANEIITKVDEILLVHSHEKSQEQEQNSASEKQSNIIGNTKYADIEDKNYFKLETKVAFAIAAELEKQGVPFSGRTGKETTTLTIGGVDVDKFKAVEKSVIPPKTENSKEPLNIIGTVKFADIANKTYSKIDSNIAVKVTEELEKQRFKFSGRVNGDTTTLTIDKADMEKYKTVVASVKSAHEQLKSADKFPEKSSDIYHYEIYQLADIPENRGFRFTSMSELKSMGLDVENASYNLIYSGAMDSNGRISEQILEDIHTRFNVDLPEDFKGHSLSVGDVISIEDNNEKSYHFCDKFGFIEIPEITTAFPPVYLDTLRNAVEKGEKSEFHQSDKLNCTCAEAIDKAVSKYRESVGMPGAAYYDLKSALADVTAEFGAVRVTAVVAHTVNNHDWDGRLSQENKDWAKTIDVPKVDYIPLDTHLAIFDNFVNYARESHAIEHENAQTVADLKEAVDNGNSISIMDLAMAVKNEKSAEAVEKTVKPRAKNSIKARIESDKSEKKSQAKSVPTVEKSKKTNIERD